MATFGNTTALADTDDLTDDWIRSTLMTVPADCSSISKIVAYLRVTSFAKDVKRGIWDDALNLVYESGATNVAVGAFQWVEFIDVPDLTAYRTDDIYVGVLSSAGAAGFCEIGNSYSVTAGAYPGYRDEHDYDLGLPNPLVPSAAWHSDYPIYCEYTPVGAGVTVKKGSNLASTMAQMLNSKMLFDLMPRPRRLP